MINLWSVLDREWNHLVSILNDLSVVLGKPIRGIWKENQTDKLGVYYNFQVRDKSDLDPGWASGYGKYRWIWDLLWIWGKSVTAVASNGLTSIHTLSWALSDSGVGQLTRYDQEDISKWDASKDLECAFTVAFALSCCPETSTWRSQSWLHRRFVANTGCQSWGTTRHQPIHLLMLPLERIP